MSSVLKIALGIALLISAAASGVQGGRDTGLDVLGRCYMKFLLTKQVVEQANIMADDAGEANAQQVRAAASEWASARNHALREELTARFRGEARTTFEGFIQSYGKAEASGDKQFLAKLGAAIGLAAAPADFTELRRGAIETVLQLDTEAGGKWLAEVQTWVDVRRKKPDAPALSVWLTRSQATKKAAESRPKSLSATEADLGEFKGAEDQVASPLDSLAEMHKQRREKKLEEAQAGMGQVAVERQAAEEEYAAKKTAAALAESDAMKRQAMTLAATEKEALEQRKNSWGNRLKSIASATVGATVGAFTGGIGARAATEAADLIFK